MQCAAVCQQFGWSQVLAYCVLPVNVTSCGVHACMRATCILAVMYALPLHSVMLVESLLTSCCHATLEGGSMRLISLLGSSLQSEAGAVIGHGISKAMTSLLKGFDYLLAAGLNRKSAVCRCRRTQHEC